VRDVVVVVVVVVGGGGEGRGGCREYCCTMMMDGGGCNDDDFTHHDPPSSSFSSPPPPSSGIMSMQPLWLFLLLLSNIPACLSSLYKEVALDTIDLNVIYLNTWVAFFQFLLTFPAILPSTLIQDIPLRDLPTNIMNGFR